MRGVGGEAEEELVGKSRGYVDSMTCTSYASVSGMSVYCIVVSYPDILFPKMDH